MFMSFLCCSSIPFDSCGEKKKLSWDLFRLNSSLKAHKNNNTKNRTRNGWCPYLGYTNYQRESIVVHARQLCEANLFSSYFYCAQTEFSAKHFPTLRTYLLFNFMFSVIKFSCTHKTRWLPSYVDFRMTSTDLHKMYSEFWHQNQQK